jgi:MFS family permease
VATERGAGDVGVYRAVLAVRDARLLISASAASQLGDWLYNAALLGYVYEATGSAAWVGAATICRLLPYVLLSPVGGMIADRYDKRTVLLVGDLLRLVNMLALAALVAFEAPVGIVIALTALASAFGTAQRPAAMAMLPRLVGEARLGPANALLHTVQDLGVVVGPAIGAVLLAVSEPWIAFAVNAATFAVSAALIMLMQQRPVPASGRHAEGTRAELAQGLRSARSTPYVVPLFLLVAMVEFTYGAQTVQLVLYAQNRLDFGSEGYGYLLALVGAGGLISAAVNGRLASSPRVAVIAVTAAAAMCATQIAYAATDMLVVASIVTLIGGFGIVCCEVVAETALARVVKTDVLGRVMGVFDALSVAAMVLGALLAPLVTSWTSLRGGLVILGVATLAVTLLCPLGLRGLEQLSRQREALLASRMAVVEALPITVGAPRVVLEQLASAAQVCPLPVGVDVVVQGAPAHAFYAVIDGSVLVHRDGEELARIGPGGYFGERGLLDNAPRNATVTTVEDSTILRLDGDVMLDALRTAPSVMSAIDRPPISPSPSAQTGTSFVDDPEWEVL